MQALPVITKVLMIVFGTRLVASGPRPTAAADSVRVSGSLVSLIRKVEVPAQESGVLDELYAKEGDQVASGGQG